jgi:hypothetical protein
MTGRLKDFYVRWVDPVKGRAGIVGSQVITRFDCRLPFQLLICLGQRCSLSGTPTLSKPHKHFAGRSKREPYPGESGHGERRELEAERCVPKSKLSLCLKYGFPLSRSWEQNMPGASALSVVIAE